MLSRAGAEGMETSNIWYFAYGSNPNIGQMMNRVRQWSASERAVAKGYERVFNHLSQRWGGLTANLRFTDNPDDVVEGAIYLIPKEKLRVLTQYEGTKPTDILVEADGALIMAKAYIFGSSEKAGKPPAAYLEVMLTGLRQHGYSEEVIERVRNLAESQ